MTHLFHWQVSGKSATCHGEVADIRRSHGDVSGFQTIATWRWFEKFPWQVGNKPVCVILMEFGNEHDTTNGLWHITASHLTDVQLSTKQYNIFLITVIHCLFCLSESDKMQMNRVHDTVNFQKSIYRLNIAKVAILSRIEVGKSATSLCHVRSKKRGEIGNVCDKTWGSLRRRRKINGDVAGLSQTS